MEPAVFLDRDNTLIANDGDLGDPAQVRLLAGVPEGLRALREAGYRLVVITNQAGVARGRFSESDVDAVHQRIATLVDDSAGERNLIDRFYYCPYHPEAELEDYRRDHPWRKPSPGMLIQASRDMRLDLASCWMIGNQGRDVAAGRTAGCRTILINGDGPPSDDARPTVVVKTFAEAVEAILQAPAPARRAVNGEPADENPGAPPAAERRARSDAPAAMLAELRRDLAELTEEIRAQRLRSNEFTAFRLAAGLCQLFALLLALLGLLQLGSTDAFTKWMLGAALAQLLTIAILLLDLKG